ncbi:coiled-coil domain-containing protein 187 [Rhinatrema bivittatum]|uniref:coiled-coil domain-containing protein 187 n=1 Tax=Rhinatrema bivittatum TaxID=194408 RepID=UPI00112E13C1|nr:coiled-coil domain-containing protein 187 [Rhinatrema bivittatum]
MSFNVDCDSVWIEASPLADVSLAWDSLFKAKDVLQRIENKLDIQELHQTQSPKVRRRPRLERQLFFSGAENNTHKGNSVSAGRVGVTMAMKGDPSFSDGGLHYVKAEENPAHRTYNGNIPSWRKKRSPDGDYDKRNDMATTFHKGKEESHSAIFLNSCKEPAVSRVYFPSTTSHELRDLDSLSNRVTSSTEMESSKEPMEDALRAHEHVLMPSSDNAVFQHAIWKDASISPLPSSSSFWDGLYIQKLECLRNRSPDSKLERLKKRIREQRQQYGKTAPELSESRPWRATQPTKRSSLRQKLRKVTFAPPPPVYKGFSAVSIKPSKLSCDGEQAESENVRLTRQEYTWRKNFIPGAQDHKENRIKTKIKHPSPAQGSSHTAVPKQRLPTPDSKLYGASAWREGQKLVRMLLGPPPTWPKLETTASLHEDKTTDNASEAVMKVLAAAAEETANTGGSVTAKTDTPAGERRCQPAQGEPARTADRQQIKDEPRTTSSPVARKNTPESAQEQEENRDPQTGLRKSRSDAGGQGQSVSPQKSQTASCGPQIKGLDKETDNQHRGEKGNMCKSRSYSVEEVREYMNKKVAERLKKDLEQKRSVQRAMELKKKRLEEVYRKQKDAFPRKRSYKEANLKTEGSKLKSEHNAEDELVRNKKKTLEAWVQLTSFSLLEGEDKGSGKLHPKRSNHITKARDGLGHSPAPDFEIDRFSPLKLKDLACCCSLTRYPFSKHYLFTRSCPKTDFKLTSPEESLKSSLYKNKQERVQAIQAVAKKLGDRIEEEAKRLSALQGSSGSGRIEASPDGLHNTSSIWKEEKFENKLNRMLNLNPSLQSLPLPVDMVQGKFDSTFHVDAKKEDDKSDLESEKSEAERENLVGVLSSSTTASEELPWNSEFGTLDGSEERKEMKDLLLNQRGDSAGIKHSWKSALMQTAENQGITTTSPCQGLFNGSTWGGSARRGDLWKIDASSEPKNPEDIIKSHSGAKLYSLKLEETGSGKDPNKIADKGDESYICPEKKYRYYLHNVQQKSLDLIRRLKIHQRHQEQELAMLRHRAELEAQKTQKSFDEFLVQKLKWLGDTKGNGTIEPSVAGHEENLEAQQFPDDTKRITGVQNITTGDKIKSQKEHFPKQPLLTMEGHDTASTDIKKISLFLDPLPAKSDDTLHSIGTISPTTELSNCERQIVEDSGDSSEQLTDSTSMWSEIGQFYGFPHTLSRFTLEMAQQYLRDEELRARHQTALLRLREDALQEKTRTELSWLEHQKMRLDVTRDHQKVADIVKQQQEILSRLQQEQAEIMHLHNIYKAAHQERKLLVKQQRAIQRMQRSTAHLQQKLHGSEDSWQLFNGQTVVMQKGGATLKLSEDDTSIPVAAMSKTGDAQSQLKKSRKYTANGTQREETPVECSQSKEGQRSEVQDMEVQKQEATMPADPNYDTTDQLSEGHALKHRDPLEHVEWAKPAVLPDESMEDHNATEFHAKGQEWESIKDMKLEACCSEDINSNYSGSMEDASSSLIKEDIPVLEKMQNEKELPTTKEKLVDFSGSESISEPMLKLNINMAAKLEKHSPSEELRGNRDQIHEETKVPYAPGWKIQEPPTPLQQDATMVNKEEKEKAAGCGEERSADGEQPAAHASSNQLESSVEVSMPKAWLVHPSSTASTKSKDSSCVLENVISYASFPDFQKVSAVLIDISDSSVSWSEGEEKNIQNTDISEPEVSDTEEKQLETLIGMEQGKEGNQLLLSTDSKEPLLYKSVDNGTSPDFEQNSENQSNISAHFTFPELHVITLSNRDIQIPVKEEPILFQVEKTTGRSEELSYEALCICLEDYKENQLMSERQFDPEESWDSSGSLNISLSYSENFTDVDENPEHSSFNPVDKTENDSEVGWCEGVHVFKDCMKTVSPVTEELKSTISLQPNNATPSDKMLPSKPLPVSIDLSISDSTANNEKCSTEGQVFCKPDEMAPVENSNLMSPKDILQATETCSSGITDLGKNNENQSTTEHLIKKQTEMVPFLSQSSKDLLSHIKCLQYQSEENVIFISDEVLIPIDEDALSEIFSPVDEVLSYKTEDLFSIEKDFSFSKEDLPSPPEEVVTINSEEMNINTEDFPSPPDQMMESEHECSDSTLEGEFTEELTLLSHQILADDLPLPSSEIMPGPPIEDGNASGWPMDTKHIYQENKVPAVYVRGKDTASLQKMEPFCIPNTDFPSSRNKEAKIFKNQPKLFLTLSEAEVDNSDSMLSFEIGCRVLVKQTQPGTLKYKGHTSFAEGYWAGVALDKPEGDHDGTYEGVKYFKCAKNCGVFVRPNQILHLLNEDKDGSSSSADEDPYDDRPSPGNYKCVDDQSRKECREPKSKEKCNNTGNPSASNENKSRSCLPAQAEKDIKERSPSTGQYVDIEHIPQSFLMSLEPVNGAGELPQMKGDPTEPYSEAARLMMEKENILGRHADKLRNVHSLQDAEREKLVKEICSELIRNLLCDALISFSETSQKKCKRALFRGDRESAGHLGEKQQQKWELFHEIHSDSFERSSEMSDWSMCDLSTFENHVKSHPMITPLEAKNIADKIVVKLIDDAMKEYKKITKRQGEKLENNTLHSSAMTQASLPFLRKLLDAGIFGGSGDFNQLDSAQHIEEIVTRRQSLYQLDHWHSAPWKNTEEVALVVPHNYLYVKKLVAHRVDELWFGQTDLSASEMVSMPQVYVDHEVTENQVNAESKRVYDQVVSDLTYELLQAQYQPSRRSSVLPCTKDKLSIQRSKNTYRKQDVNEIKSYIQGEVVKILKLERNDLETKRKLLRNAKFQNRKRDRVDLLLIQELHKEEAQWTEYSEDELAVKMKVTEDIFESLVVDTIEVLKKIYLKKTQL